MSMTQSTHEITGPQTDGGLAAPADDDPELAEGMAALDAAFSGSPEAADAAAAVIAESPRVNEIVAPIPTNKGRVALLDWMGDDSISMGAKFFRLMMRGYDKMIEMLRAQIQHDAVETLVAASLLNAGPIHGYMPLANLPLLGNTPDVLHGQTHWLLRFSEQLAALALQVGHYESQGRETTGVAFIGVDGYDTEMLKLRDRHPFNYREKIAERRDNLRSMIEGYRKAGNISVAVAHMGNLVVPSDAAYEEELTYIRDARRCIGLESPSRMTQQELIVDMYRQLGFPEDMIFMPGADMSRLAAVLAAVSRSMVQRSRGEKPRGNRDVSFQRY